MEPTSLNYPQIRRQIKNGDVFVYQGKGFLSPRFGWISPIVRWFSNSLYTHAGMAVWWDDRLMVMEAIGKGVIANPVSMSFERYKADIDWFTSRQEISDDDRLKMVGFAKEQLGKRFGLWNACLLMVKMKLGLSFSKNDRFKEAERLYCSQLVAHVYNFQGIDLRERRSDRFMSPKDIAASTMLEKMGRVTK